MSIATIYLLGCEVINFEINPIFLIKPFFYMTKMSSDFIGIRTQNHLLRKRTLNHLAILASLAKWVSVRLRAKWL